MSGERLLLGATLDEIRLRQTMRKLPIHMTIIGWVSVPDSQRHILSDEMDKHLQQPLFQEARGGEPVLFGPNNDIPAREILHVEKYPWFALHALVQSIGSFPPDDQFAHLFSPHVTDTDERSVGENEPVNFPSIALFARSDEDPIKRVEAAYQFNPEKAMYERET